jgi:alanine racemase
MTTLAAEVKAPAPARRRFFRPTWAEVDLGALDRNLRRIRAKMPAGTKIMFVVKANAYGHDAALCARAAEKARAADWLGVSSVEEGIALRDAGVRLPVLILGSLYPFESVLAAVAHDLTPVVASLEAAKRLVEVAVKLQRRVDCHVKVDTGMGRIGSRRSRPSASRGSTPTSPAPRATRRSRPSSSSASGRWWTRSRARACGRRSCTPRTRPAR